MINRIKLFIFELYLSYIARTNKKRLEQELNKYLNSIGGSEFEVVQDANQYKLAQAVAKIKRAVNERVKTQGDYHKVLSDVSDLALLSNSSYEISKVKAILYRMHVKKGLDIANEKDKEQMIESRINDYYELQRYNEERALLKAIKKAKKDNNKELQQQLTEEWKHKYGNSRRN